jgi:hypothetical protein
MKHKILLCVTIVLAGLTLLLISPTITPVLSKNSNSLPTKIRPHAMAMAHVALAPDNDASEIQRGFEIAPVNLDLKGKNRALVGLGSYIVNTGGCNDCHTNPPYADGGDPFQGQPEQINVDCYLSGGMSFGPFVSRNLTPDAQGLPAGLTLDLFIHTLRTGQDPQEPGELLQVMPWPVFGKKTDRDLTAIYEYLRSIPHRATCAAP